MSRRENSGSGEPAVDEAAPRSAPAGSRNRTSRAGRASRRTSAGAREAHERGAASGERERPASEAAAATEGGDDARTATHASEAGRKACCMISELLEESGIDREHIRQARRQVLQGVMLLCQWQLQRMEEARARAASAAEGTRGRKKASSRRGRNITID